MNLARLQAQFAAGLHYQASGEECSVSPQRFSADAHLQIYRNNFVISLSEILVATYPLLVAVLGEECFGQIARQHVLNHPLSEADVSSYGKDLSKTLLLFPQVMQQAPYCAEIARFEWQLDCTRQQYEHHSAKHVEPLQQLTALSEQQHAHLVFHVKHAAQLFESPLALFSLREAIQNQAISDFNLDQPQQGILLWEQQQLRSVALSKPQYQLLQAVIDAKTLGEIAPELLSELEPLFQLGLISGFSLSSSATDAQSRSEK